MKLPVKAQNNLKSFFKEDFKVTRIEKQLTKEENLVVIKFPSLKAEVYAVMKLDWSLSYIL